MKLQQAQIGIRQGEDWQIRTPGQEILATLPRCLTDDQVIHIFEFAQAYEKAAHEDGVRIGRGALQAVHEQQKAALVDRIRSLEAHNAMLAEKVEQLLDGDQPHGND